MDKKYKNLIIELLKECPQGSVVRFGITGEGIKPNFQIEIKTAYLNSGKAQDNLWDESNLTESRYTLDDLENNENTWDEIHQTISS